MIFETEPFGWTHTGYLIILRDLFTLFSQINIWEGYRFMLELFYAKNSVLYYKFCTKCTFKWPNSRWNIGVQLPAEWKMWQLELIQKDRLASWLVFYNSVLVLASALTDAEKLDNRKMTEDMNWWNTTVFQVAWSWCRRKIKIPLFTSIFSLAKKARRLYWQRGLSQYTAVK